MRPRLILTAMTVMACLQPVVAARAADVRSLDGAGNNLQHPEWARAGEPYPRVAPAAYADGVAAPLPGPSPRAVSNRIFNDVAQNLFSENGVSQWGAVWGQFLDHTFGLRQEAGGESAPLAFNAGDPLEAFHNDLGSLAFRRTPAVPGTGTVGPREQANVVGGYIDASAVYGDDPARLAWLRAGARLLLPDGYLPRAGVRGDAATAPAMTAFGRQQAQPDAVVEAGDRRANESIGLTAVQTLFAREHNRIADALPADLPDDERFEIARRVVGAEQQYITYTEFLPALGVALPRYRGYDPGVDAAVSDEFATVGFRAHSMVHGEIEPVAPAGAYSEQQLQAFEAQGIEVEQEDGTVTLVVPLNLAFGNPDLLQAAGLGPVLAGIGAEREYRNDEQVDNQLRSVLFGVPRPGADAAACLDGADLPQCFTGVSDLVATDIARGRDHGIPRYNALRSAYGLAPATSFTDITAEGTDRFRAGLSIDDPAALDFVALADDEGNPIALGSDAAETDAVTGERRSTVAARLRATYASPDDLDAFVGMSAERHVPGTEFGALQLAMWRAQFTALRDGDRFFYADDPELAAIERRYGISYRTTLAQVVERNTGAVVQPEVFKAAD